MKLSLLTDTSATTLFGDAIGGNLASFDLAAELLRHELSARGRCPRHFLVARVCRTAAPVHPLDPEAVGDTCDELERHGDIVVAEGAVLYPTPVRIVVLGEGVFRFVCTVPSSRLLPSVEGDWMRVGVRRDCRVRQPIEEVAASLGAAVMSPEVWAGLEKSPAADAGFLRSLNARLEWAPEPAGSLEQDEALEWSALTLEQGEARWRTSATSTLWRARHRWKRWVYAWTRGESPRTQAFVSLQADEGTRAGFALARGARPYRGTIKTSNGITTIALAAWVPFAEFRFLTTCAEQVVNAARGSSWSMPEARAGSVVATLTQRLGLQIEQVQA